MFRHRVISGGAAGETGPERGAEERDEQLEDRDDDGVRSLLRALREDAGCWLVVFSRTETVVDANATAVRTFPVPADHVLGRPIGEILPSELAPMVEAYVQHCLEWRSARARFILGGIQWETMARRVMLPEHGPCVVCTGQVAPSAWPLKETLELLEPRTCRPCFLGDLHALSERELEVALLIGSGASDRQSAAVLHRSPRTIHTHRRTLGRKLAIAGRAELVGLMHARGLTVTWRADELETASDASDGRLESPGSGDASSSILPAH